MKKKLKVIFILLIFFINVNFVFGLLNPSAVYCKAMGYNYVINNTEDGQQGICILSNNDSVSAWNFLQGIEGQKYNFCNIKGYSFKIINDSIKCSSIFSKECTVCVLENNEEVEVTKLMNLSYQEGICGDKKCVLGENFKNCPQDCKSGSFDYYCDAIKDNKCDPDCLNNKDIDCSKKEQFNWLIIIFPILIILIISGIILFLRKRNKL